MEVRAFLPPIITARTRVLFVCLSVDPSTWCEFHCRIHTIALITLCHVDHATDNRVSTISATFIADKLAHAHAKLLPNGTSLILLSAGVASRIRMIIGNHLMPALDVVARASWFTHRTAELPTVSGSSTSRHFPIF